MTAIMAVLTLFRLFIGRYFPLIGDEGFYWLWSKHLDFSYVDHPPMIAYYIKGLTLIFGDSELAIRLGAVILVTLTTILVYKIGKELFGTQAGILSAIIFSALPTFLAGSLFLVPQQPFLLFWTLSLYLFIKLIKTGKAWWWYLLGIAAGLGLLSDYVMFLFFPAVGLYLILNKRLRFWWSRKEPYLGAIIAGLMFSPVIIWNLKHGFIPLFYWTGKMGGTPNYIHNLLSFISLEMILYTPVVFLMVLYLIMQMRNFEENTTLLGCLSLPVFLTFLSISPLMLIGGHWPAAAYIPAILLIGQLKSRRLFSLTLFFAILVNCLGFAYYLFLYPTPPELIGKEFTINKQLPEFLEASSTKMVFANNLGLAGLVSFHGKVKVHMAAGRLKQFDLWGKPKLEKSDNLIYFVLNESEVYDKLVPIFRMVKREPHKRIFTKDADIPNKTEIYHCIGFRGGSIP